MKNVIDVCPHCGNVNPIPSFAGMVADRCEPCALSFDETKAKYGLSTALYYQFIQSMNRAKEALNQEGIEELINRAISNEDNCLVLTEDVYLVINNNGLGTFQAVIHYTPSFWNDLVVFTCTYTSKHHPGIKRLAERIIHKIKKWKPGIVFETMLEATYNWAFLAQQYSHVEDVLSHTQTRRPMVEELVLALPLWKRTIKNLKKIFRH